MAIEAQIRNYLDQYLLFAYDSLEYSNSDSFLARNLIDSTTVTELVFFAEDTFGIEVADVEITPDNFDSVDKLANFIRSKVPVSQL